MIEALPTYMNQQQQSNQLNATLMFFLKTGRLGPLKCGLTREEVRRQLGDPQSYDGKESAALNWRYDPLIVYFEEHQVIGYGVAFHAGHPLPTCIDGLANPAYFEMPMRELLSQLTSAGVAFERCNNGEPIRTVGGVLIFSNTEDILSNMVFTCPGEHHMRKFDASYRKSSTAASSTISKS